MTREEALQSAKFTYEASRRACEMRYYADLTLAADLYSAERDRINKDYNKPTPTDPVTGRAKLGALRIAAEQTGILNDKEAIALIMKASPTFAAAYEAVRDRLRAETEEVAE